MSYRRSELIIEEWEDILDARQRKRGVAAASSLCGNSIRYELGGNGEMKGVSDQSYTISQDGKKRVTVSSPSSIGFLYATYEILDKLGFRWFSPTHTSRPDILDWERINSLGGSYKPRIKHRGFYTHGGVVSSEFLLWMARNRFNLVGGVGPNAEYAHQLGVNIAEGGHDVISNLTPTELALPDGTLIDVHPEWFGLNTKAKISEGADSYSNPCFADDTYIEFFVDRLHEEVISGRYRNADIIHLWPSDSAGLIVPDTCVKPDGVLTSSDQLAYFYNRVVDLLHEKKTASIRKRKLIIAGISYYGSFDVRKNKVILPSSYSDIGYIHNFYLNLRSFSTPLHSKQSSLNESIYETVMAGVESHDKSEFGIVDYHNYSIYFGVVAPLLKVLQKDMALYDSNKVSLYAYMHPLDDQHDFSELLNRLISKLSFSSGEAENLLADFVKYKYSADPRMYDLMYLYDEALANKAEIMGNYSSLNLVLQADVFWRKGPLVHAEIMAYAEDFMKGNEFVMPDVRFDTYGENVFTVNGLDDSISKLKKVELLLVEITRTNHAIDLTSIRDEVARVTGIYQQYKRMFALRNIDSKKSCDLLGREYQEGLINVLSLPWKKTVSRIDQKTKYKDQMTHYYKSVIKKRTGCEAIHSVGF